MAIDRRAARTRTALFDALVALIRRKDYELITVQDILHEANVGRSTFYAHFTSKDDLLERSLERLRAMLAAAQEEAGRRSSHQPDGCWDPSRALFEHVAEYADIQVALAGGRGGAIVRDAADEVLAGLLRTSFPAQLPGCLPRELAIQHVVSTFNTTLRWWLNHRPDMSAAEVDALFRELILQGLPEESCMSFIAPTGS